MSPIDKSVKNLSTYFMNIILADFSDLQVRALLHVHLNEMDAASPEDSNYTLDISGLQGDDITFWTIWDGDKLAGFGALKELTSKSAEIKSMRTHTDHLRKGVAAQLLTHLINIAKDRDYVRVSLETGTTSEFDAALTLYRKHGFQNGEIFGDYRPSPYNQFLHLDL